MRQVLDWLGAGLRESLAMIWTTFWPLVLGFGLSGLVQSLVPRNGLRASLGTTSPRSAARATALGVVSSSCSYAASAMSRALFARGASFTNSLVFLVASTNLVIELGLVLYFLLGWQFVVAEFVGGLIMIAGLVLLTRLFVGAPGEDRLRARVRREVPEDRSSSVGLRDRLRDPRYYREAARCSLGDVVMLRKELVAGFLVAGFLIVHVPSAWWSHVFVSGHGVWALLENAAVAPLVAMVSFVCSVGNVPLAAALWVHGVAFGGVISFVFADLVTLPLLFIYRRFYGTGTALRLVALLWPLMSLAGVLVDLAFRAASLVPRSRFSPTLAGHFARGSTLVLNGLALVALVVLWLLARHPDAGVAATDPVCGMRVETSAPAATRVHDGVTYYFCSPRCATKFDDADLAPGPGPNAVDPVCAMAVSAHDAPSARGRGGVTYYFCSPGCRSTFLGLERSPGSKTTERGPTP
ncbi:MAG: permease [Acidimicrobiales bacterium]